MRRTMVFPLAIIGGLVAVSAPAAAAPSTPCPAASGGSTAAYSNNEVEVSCTPSATPSPLPDLPFTESGANPATSPGRTLPFTGGEFVLITVVGVGAIAGGTTLVLAGRKRGRAGHGA